MKCSLTGKNFPVVVRGYAIVDVPDQAELLVRLSRYGGFGRQAHQHRISALAR